MSSQPATPYTIIESADFLESITSVLKDEEIWMELRTHLDLLIAGNPDSYKQEAGMHVVPALTLRFEVDHEAKRVLYRELVPL